MKKLILSKKIFKKKIEKIWLNLSLSLPQKPCGNGIKAVGVRKTGTIEFFIRGFKKCWC